MRVLSEKPFSVRILISILICLSGIILEAQLQPILPGRFIVIYPFLFFILYFAGFFAGLISIGFYVLATSLIPYSIPHSVNTYGQLKIILFCVSGFLVALVIEYNRKLEQQLKRQTIELEEALKIRDEFLSMASHELKTPLTALKLHSQHFMKGIEQGDPSVYSPQRIGTFAKQVEKQVAKLNILIEDMLDISRIRSGRLKIKPHEFNLVDLMKDVEEILKAPFDTYNSPRPIIERNHEDVLVKWDKLRIEQVIINLFMNAIRNGEGKPIIVNTSIADDKISITIKDHGVGISKENASKIFDCYANLNASSETNGLGLDLFISKQIIEAHQGQLTVESKLGSGSTFRIDLPR